MARTNTNTGGSGGLTQVYHDSTLTGLGTSGSPLGVVMGGSSPFTIENTSSIFSTGAPGAWNSTATNSFIAGPYAGQNDNGITDSVIWMGLYAGYNDLSGIMNASNTVFLGNRAGFNAFNTDSSTFIGYLAGAYAEHAAYSVFIGSQAGISATNAGNSFFFGQGAGHNATNASSTILMGLLAGYDATNAAYSNFFGSRAGQDASSANNSTFIGSYAGYNDSVNNSGLITYSSESHLFTNSINLSSSSGGTAVTLYDDASGNLYIVDSKGSFNVGDTITEQYSGYTMTLTSYTPSTASVLIGDHTSTGGGKNSVVIGAHGSNAGYNNSIAIGVGALNTADNQYAWGDSIINWRFSGNDFALPTISPSGTGQALMVAPGNQLYWGVPGSVSPVSIAVVAATTTNLPPFNYTYMGMGGVGDYITAASNGAFPAIDGITINVGDRFLDKNESLSPQYNGVYILSDAGSPSTPWIATRTTDADTAGQFNDMVVIPAQGTQSATPFGQTSIIVNVGYDPISFMAQSSLYVREQTAGIQLPQQVPVWSATAQTLTTGTQGFVYNPATGNFFIGNSTIGTGLQFIDATNTSTTLELTAYGFDMFIPSGGSAFSIDTVGGTTANISLGASGFGNNTYLAIQDSTKSIILYGLQDFPNDSAAYAGGIGHDALYYTTATVAVTGVCDIGDRIIKITS